MLGFRLATYFDRESGDHPVSNLGYDIFMKFKDILLRPNHFFTEPNPTKLTETKPNLYRSSLNHYKITISSVKNMTLKNFS